VLGLAEIHVPGTHVHQPLQLGVEVVGAQVEVQPIVGPPLAVA